jgi:hypothetical protein
MTENNPLDSFDWSLTTWEGSRREQLRRWAQLTLEEIVQAQEEMADLSEYFADMRRRTGSAHSAASATASVREPSARSVSPAKRDDDAS